MPANSPWKTLTEAGARIGRGKRFLRREWKAGRLRGAVIGSRKEILTRDEWIDDWVADQVKPVDVLRRRA